jgi:hypothetical protein
MFLFFRRKPVTLPKDKPAQKTAPHSIGFFSALALVLASIVITLAGGEWYLRYRHKSMQADRIDSGLIRYHHLLGWELSPGFYGRHRHEDFDVAYTINSLGFRNSFNEPVKGRGKTIAFVGDSFTFGQGVDDTDPFVAQLNLDNASRDVFLNCSVPGFSTDQQLLLIRSRVIDFKPDTIVLVVYLGNDLFDNLLAFPLQADNAKPFFVWSNGRLILKNTPVPHIRKTKTDQTRNLKKVGLINGPPRNKFLKRLENLRLYQLVQNAVYTKRSRIAELTPTFEQAIELFKALIQQIQQICIAKNMDFYLVLMPGKSYVELPGSPQAGRQELFRKEIIKIGRGQDIQVIDLASHLRFRYQKSKARHFFPHEGHLTKQGHQVAANFIKARLTLQASE